VAEKYSDLTLALGLDMGDRSAMAVQAQLQSRIQGIKVEHDQFADEARRMDDLFYTTDFSVFGADLYPDDPNLKIDGRSHVSVNTPQVYVEVPAALQAVEPIENIVAIEDSEEARDDANALERIRESWRVDEMWQLKRHKAATIKGLYGRTASFVYPDKEKGYACADVVINPRNLYLGFKDDNYDQLEWAAQVTLMDPNTVMERYSVDVDVKALQDGTIIPWVVGPSGDPSTGADIPRPELNWGPCRIEVWDYWYRKVASKGKRGSYAKMETWNVIVVGNEVVREQKYGYYGGTIPYVPLFNTFIPGTPTGRSELHDMEQLIREKMTRITAGAQMIQKATAGDYWQVTGENAPARGIAQVKPIMNQTVSPGPGNRFEAIAPFIAEFQLEQFLGRLDREMAVISGLNDLLLGLAPSAVLNSSKAINALVANYESRISMRRLLFYEWDRKTWELTCKVWSNMSGKTGDFMKQIVKNGMPRLDIIDPSLSPRDEMETATRAANLVNAKLWSQARGMDAVGVDDPEQEQNIIRRESTDATLWPDRVNLMVQLMTALNAAQAQMPPGAQEQAQGQQASGGAALQSALGLGEATPENGLSSQLGGDQGITPDVAGAGNSPFAQGPQGAAAQGATGPQATQVQSMIQGGKLSGRILNNTKYGRR
jgi:hypothetical protein